jgi:Tol biopolymer transport system component
MRREFRFLLVIVPLFALALSSCSKGGNELVGPEGTEDGAIILKKGGGGKPPKDPPPPADPAIAYTSNGLMVMNADGSNQTQVYSVSDVSEPSWSPDGGSVAFMYRHGSPSWQMDLWRIDISVVDDVPVGSNPTLLETDVGFSPTWSPAGDVIAYPISVSDTSASFLMTIPANGGPVDTLYTAPLPYQILYPTWSSDGTRIAFSEGIYYTNPDQVFLKILEIATGTVTTVVGPVDYRFSNLEWARTKDEVAFQAGVASVGGLYTLDLTEQNPTPQLISGGDKRSPSWAPDDSKLAYSQWVRRNRLDINTYDFATGEIKTLARGMFPDWRRF